jgi:predicted phage gp36 major capsid-like protein
LENKVQVLESQQRDELEDMREEKNRLQGLVRTQTTAIEALERQLRVASTNNSALQRQHQQLMESVHTLINMVSTGTGRNTFRSSGFVKCSLLSDKSTLG